MKEKKYPEHKNQTPATLRDKILKFWKENNIFNQSIDNREGSKPFIFYEGPPGANGAPGIHHVLSRTIKDIFCRYKTLKGYKVERRAGWDTHGLPVEIAVEKSLGITKDDVGKSISIEDYNKECKKAVMVYKDKWDTLTTKMGYWTDLENPYITFNNGYMESVWNLLKKFHEKNLIYKGYTVQPFSPAAGTGLSTNELNFPGCYKDVKDTSIVAQFKLKKTVSSEKEDETFSENTEEYFLAWTTTPWTLPANSALAVGKNIQYVKIETINPYTFIPVKVILAKDAIYRYFNPQNEVKNGDINRNHNLKHGDKNLPWKLIDNFTGSDLINEEYEQLLPYIKPEGNAFKVIEGDFVSTEDGTGIVHIAPTFGADDMRVGKKANIPPIMIKDSTGKNLPIVDQQGKFVKEITDFAGLYVKEEYESEEKRNEPNFLSTDVQIAIKLKKENKAFRVEKYEHSYPHCWRTDKPILYYPLDSWFIKTTASKKRLIELNKTINWVPESTGIGRFGNWLENLVDWNLSRDRFWGIPLPIWRTEDQKEEKCIGSIEELQNEVSKSIKEGFMKDQLPENFDLHKPFVDEVILVSNSGKRMLREKDVIDVWFDSGAMPYAQLHYPFENADIFKDNFPADLIAEGVDQTRGWFFTLHTIAVMLFDSVAFKNVVVNGLVLDKSGNKMSKRHGNSVDPIEVIDKYGADVLRWYMVSNSNPWDNLKFDIEELIKVQRRFFNTLENTYSFFALYANIDNFNFNNEIENKNLIESDRWIISKLNSLQKQVDNCFNKYDTTKAARLIQDFVVDDLSNWYVRLNRKRFWKSENNIDKKAAYQTLYDCLVTIAKISSPIAPFYMERLFLDLNSVTKKDNSESVHLSNFPSPDEKKIDLDLEKKMNKAQIITSLVHSIRKNSKIKVRQPLQKILLPPFKEDEKKSIESLQKLILSEINVKEIKFIDTAQNIIKKRVKPNFKKLGKEYGPYMKQIAEAINLLNQDDIFEIETKGSFELKINFNELNSITIKKEDVIISSEDIPGWAVASSNGITVALDTTITDDLFKEGLAREFINRVQNLRKDMGLDVQDKINIEIQKNNDNKLEDALSIHKEYICKETQSKFKIVGNLIDSTPLEIDSNIIKLQINIDNK